MNRAQIFILILFATGSGVGVYFYIKSKQQQVAQQASDQAQQAATAAAAQQKAKEAFCNPPTTDVYQKIAIQRQLAQQEWDRRGRGMDLDYFIQQYIVEMGCPG